MGAHFFKETLSTTADHLLALNVQNTFVIGDKTAQLFSVSETQKSKTAASRPGIDSQPSGILVNAKTIFCDSADVATLETV